jgi:hypothetical protein
MKISPTMFWIPISPPMLPPHRCIPLEPNQLHDEHKESSTHPIGEGPTPEDCQAELPLTP